MNLLHKRAETGQKERLEGNIMKMESLVSSEFNQELRRTQIQSHGANKQKQQLSI